MTAPPDARATARLSMPERLRGDVRLLGELLGQIVAESGGAELLNEVERLRQAVIVARDDAEHERRCDLLVTGWSLDRAEEVARAFTCYFHLANLSEEHHRQRVLRERERGAPLPESLAATVAAAQAGGNGTRLLDQLSDLRVHPVLTAHPTEARRRAVVDAMRRIAEQLTRLDDPRCSDSERADVRRRLLEEIDILWRTAQIRTVRVDPLDEVRATLRVFDETLFETVPIIYRLLDTALSPNDVGRRPPRAPSFIRFGSWAGGDRDGNPLVTAAVTAQAMGVHVGQALRALESATSKVARAITAEARMAPASPTLTSRLEQARIQDPQGYSLIARSSSDEPHRQFLLHVARRLRATREDVATFGYRGPDEFIDDLRTTQASLAAGGAGRLAYGELQHLVWQAESFGFCLAELEIRQHSRVHERALAELHHVRPGEPLSAATQEVLDTLGVVAQLQQRYGRSACRRYVVSFTRSAADVAAVYELAEHAGGETPPVLDVVPLFESADDLRRSTTVLDGVIELPPVQRRLADNGRRLEVMLGYSDSAKEMGPVAATFALFDAQTELVAWAARHSVTLTIFHGRGGAMGRGGGPANRAVLAQPPGSMAGGFKVTEQGEVIFARYGNRAIARRHLEQVASAVLVASAPAVEERVAKAAARFRALADRTSQAARLSYHALVGADGFAEWFARVSPLEELDRLRLGSRPARRAGGGSLGDLRAIPWVFAWSQMRLNLPGWYGLGSGLQAARLAELREAYAEWPLFASLLDNAEMSLAKTDRRIAARYLGLGARRDLTDKVLAEYDRTMEQLLAVTGHDRLLADRPVLSWAVALRNPYVDALSHIQLRALRELRAGAAGPVRDRLERLLLLTVNGVAAGLQNTG